jgi:hypothetical protein
MKRGEENYSSRKSSTDEEISVELSNLPSNESEQETDKSESKTQNKSILHDAPRVSQ